jgi:hypothetical protein
MIVLLIIILWIITGIWISFKRDWYIDDKDDAEIAVILNVMFAPIALIIALFRVFFVNGW